MQNAITTHGTILELSDTKALAQALTHYLKPGAVIALDGDLGAGKTTFTQFLCQCLGVDDYVTSPTFNIMNTYEGTLQGAPLHIYHFDVYRIHDPDDMDEIGFDEFIYGKGISIVEWAKLVADHLPKETIWLNLGFDEGGNRTYQIKGDMYENFNG